MSEDPNEHSKRLLDLREFYETCEEHRALLRDVFVALPVRPHDGVCVQLNKVLSIWFKEDIEYDTLEDSMGGFIELTRTNIALDFLRNRRQKYLLMIDNDTEPPLGLPYMLARHDQPIVGACIVSYSRYGRPMLCFSRPDRGGVNRFIDFEDGDKIPMSGLVEVPHVGTGAMLIRRDVLESFTWEEGDSPFLVPEKFKIAGSLTGQLMRGEDIQFCIMARAKGFKIHVDLEAHCGHRKSMRLAFPPSQRDPSMLPEEFISNEKGIHLSSV